MAGLAAVATLAGAVVSGIGTIMAGDAASKSAEAEAQQRQQQANEARAASQREAIQRAREMRLLQSRQQAVASSSGGAATDPGVVRLMADAGQQGRYNVASAIYEGESRGRAFEYAGQIARWQGEQQKKASYIDAGSTMLGGISSMAGGLATSGMKIPTFRKRPPLDLEPYRL